LAAIYIDNNNWMGQSRFSKKLPGLFPEYLKDLTKSLSFQAPTQNLSVTNFKRRYNKADEYQVVTMTVQKCTSQEGQR